MPTEKGWAIDGPHGLYVGWWLTRKAAIEEHVRHKVILGPSADPIKDIWKLCQKAGDRVVRVTIKYPSR